MVEDYFINEALGSLPENLKIHADTQVKLLDESTLIAVNPNFAPLIYKRSTSKWEELKFEDREKIPWADRP